MTQQPRKQPLFHSGLSADGINSSLNLVVCRVLSFSGLRKSRFRILCFLFSFHTVSCLLTLERRPEYCSMVLYRAQDRMYTRHIFYHWATTLVHKMRFFSFVAAVVFNFFLLVIDKIIIRVEFHTVLTTNAVCPSHLQWSAIHGSLSWGVYSSFMNSSEVAVTAASLMYVYYLLWEQTQEAAHLWVVPCLLNRPGSRPSTTRKSYGSGGSSSVVLSI